MLLGEKARDHEVDTAAINNSTSAMAVDFRYLAWIRGALPHQSCTNGFANRRRSYQDEYE